MTTLERAIFLLSGTELGGSETWLNVEGTALPAASVLKIAELNGKATNFWTRSPYVGTTFTVALMSYRGTIGHNDCQYAQGARPAFTLPGATTFVDDSGAIVFNDPPPTPTLTPPTDCIWGVPATATCTAVEDPDGDTVAYEWGMSYDKEAWQELSGDTDSCTYTAFADHYLRVRAVDTAGNASGYDTTALITVQRWGGQIIYGGGA